MSWDQDPRCMSSEYMQWAKQHVAVRFPLSSSGVANFPLSGLPTRIEDLEITGNSTYGYPPLQEALAAHCLVPSERVFATMGTSLANHIAMAAVIRPGDEVLIELPTYELIVDTARYLGARINRFGRKAADGFRVDAEEVERKITQKTRLIVLTNLHNPSSAFTDEPTLQRIGEIAGRVGAMVLVDEVYLDAHFEASPRSAIRLGEQFVITNSLTKVYGLSGLRCGWVLATPALVRKMWLLNDLFINIPPHATERLNVIALHHLSKIRSRARSFLEQNHQTLRQTILKRNDVECASSGFGTVVFPRLRSGTSQKLYDIAMEKYSTSIVPGRFFQMPEHFRIGLGGDPELFAEGIANVCRALDDLDRKS